MQPAEAFTHPPFELGNNPLEEYTREYCASIFSGEAGQKLHITPEASQWMTNHIVDYVARPMDAMTRDMMIGKIVHTYHVVKAIVMIAENMPHHPWDLQQVALAGMGHDITRFDQAYDQATFKERADSLWRHAHKGAEMMENAPLSITPESRRAIVHAIDKHSDKTYDGEEWLAKLLRDADKLALLAEFAQIGDIDVKSYTDGPPSRGELPENAYNDFFKGNLVDNGHTETYGDVMIRYLSWMNGLYFPETRRILAETNILERIAEKLTDYYPDDPFVQKNYPEILDQIVQFKKEAPQAA